MHAPITDSKLRDMSRRSGCLRKPVPAFQPGHRTSQRVRLPLGATHPMRQIVGARAIPPAPVSTSTTRVDCTYHAHLCAISTLAVPKNKFETG